MKKYKKKLLITIVLIIFTFFGIRLYFDNETFDITLYTATLTNDNEITIKSNKDNYILTIPNKNIYEEIKGKIILQISDLHNKEYGKNNIDLLKSIDIINPDYVFLTGDMVSSEDVDFGGFYSLAKSLAEKYTCYYVPGNHECGLSYSKYKELLNEINKLSVINLDGKKVNLSNNVVLYGLNYDEIYYYPKNHFSVDKIEKELGKTDNTKFNILITHDPKDFDNYCKWGADIVFAGHTHGGMIRMFDVGIISTDRTLFPKYDGGLFENTIDNQNQNILVDSKGLSRGHIGFRLFNKPELVVLEFK